MLTYLRISWNRFIYHKKFTVKLFETGAQRTRKIHFPQFCILSGTSSALVFFSPEPWIFLVRNRIPLCTGSVLTPFTVLIFIVTNYYTSIGFCKIFHLKIYTFFIFIGVNYQCLYFMSVNYKLDMNINSCCFFMLSYTNYFLLYFKCIGKVFSNSTTSFY